MAVHRPGMCRTKLTVKEISCILCILKEIQWISYPLLSTQVNRRLSTFIIIYISTPV